MEGVTVRGHHPECRVTFGRGDPILFKNMAPTYLANLIPPSVHQVSQRNLRNYSDLTVPRSRTNLYNKSFIPVATREWNSLPENMKTCTFLASFKLVFLLDQGKPKVPKYYYQGERKRKFCMHVYGWDAAL